MKTNKFLPVLFAIVVVISTIFTFNTTDESSPKESSKINIGALDGVFGLGLVKLEDDEKNDITKGGYSVTYENDAYQLADKIISSEYDMVTVPLNLASIIYNKTDGDVSILAINTLGALGLLSTDKNIKNIKNLKGKTIYSYGLGETNEYVTDYLLGKNGLKVGEDVFVKYKDTHQELEDILLDGEGTNVILPFPFATKVLSENENVKLAFSFNDEWNESVTDNTKFAMGCIIVRNSFLNQNKEDVNLFLDQYKRSIDYINSDVSSNEYEDLVKLTDNGEILTYEIVKNAIPNCGVYYMDGEEMKVTTKNFLNLLYGFDDKYIGGKIPDDNFYYKR
ncbi:MAG: ABC transporter substrate-binding protein [Oscillospiraceae bacterium]